MTNYYLIENGIITQSADFRFDGNCLETEEEIVRSEEGVLMLQSEHDTHIQTPEYTQSQKDLQINSIQEKYKGIMNEYICAKVKRDLFETEEYQSMLEDMYNEISEVQNG
jgi:hypothetical protein